MLRAFSATYFSHIAVSFLEPQSASPGEIVLFRCTNDTQDLPIWFINDVQHSPSDLPPGHWVNSSGLVVQARPELDRTMYRCLVISVQNIPGTTKPGVGRSECGPVALSVSPSGTTAQTLASLHTTYFVVPLHVW